MQLHLEQFFVCYTNPQQVAPQQIPKEPVREFKSPFSFLSKKQPEPEPEPEPKKNFLKDEVPGILGVITLLGVAVFSGKYAVELAGSFNPAQEQCECVHPTHNSVVILGVPFWLFPVQKLFNCYRGMEMWLLQWFCL